MIDYDMWCMRCRNYIFDIDRGILCAITGDKPAFKGECPFFELDPERDRKTKPKHTQKDELLHTQESTFNEDLRNEHRHKVGANWFFWLAGLSMVNSLILLFGGERSFIIGLGITQIVDLLSRELVAETGPGIIYGALTIDVLFAGIFVFFGIVARRRQLWAFVVGMSLYATDGLIFVFAGDLLGIGFHIFALFGLYGGFKACKATSMTQKLATFKR